MTHVVFVLVPRLHMLDLAGPAQVFFSAADLGLDYRMSYVAEHADVPTAQGVMLRADTAWPSLDRDDLVVVPGWRASPGDDLVKINAATARNLAAHHEAGGTVASVCSGAYALGQAGLLDGRRCTTHHELTDEMVRHYPCATVVPDVLYVEDDRVVTSAGIASGIDLALHLIAVRHGPAAAAKIARAMVIFTRRNGDASQSSAMLRHRAHLSDVVHRVQDRIDSGFAQQLRLAELAGAAGVSQRTLTRLFHRHTGLTPLRYQQVLRTERAEHLISHGATVDSASRAVGFADARMLRRLRSRPVDRSETG